MMFYENDSFAEAYRSVLYDLIHNYDYETSPRGSKVREITNVAIQINNPYSNLYKNEIRSSQKKYIAAECVWYFSGTNTTDFIDDYAKMWKTIANPGGTVNSAYGYQILNDKNDNLITEWEWAVKSLVEDKDSRQAIMHINKPVHNRPGIKDYPCTLTIGFMIREDKLNMTVHMRSNDAILGLPTDFAEFSIMQQQMLRHLRHTYPLLELGSYIHFVDSMHIYERHFDLADKMLRYAFIADELEQLDVDLCYPNGEASEITKELYTTKTCRSLSKFALHIVGLLNW